MPQLETENEPEKELRGSYKAPPNRVNEEFNYAVKEPNRGLRESN